MADFRLPESLVHNTEPIADPEAYVREKRVRSWLYLVGDEFASTEGGMSYAQVQAAVPESARVVSDPPVALDLELARRHVSALDALPRPTLISCRAGPRAAAVAYMYSGLRAQADPRVVLEEADRAGAPFCRFEEYRTWVRQSIEALGAEGV
jgi:hypothetical protein